MVNSSRNALGLSNHHKAARAPLYLSTPPGQALLGARKRVKQAGLQDGPAFLGFLLPLTSFLCSLGAQILALKPD